MKRFQFRFQRVLEIKERVEDVRKVALGQVVGVYETERRELARLEQLQRDQVSTERAQPGQPVDPGMLRLLTAYGARLQREAGEQAEQVRVVGALVEEKRSSLMEATRERRVFEILRERDQEAHRKQARRQELARLDEVGGQLHLRRRGAGETPTSERRQSEA